MRFSPLLFVDLSLSLLVVTGLPITDYRTKGVRASLCPAPDRAFASGEY